MEFEGFDYMCKLRFFLPPISLSMMNLILIHYLCNFLHVEVSQYENKKIKYHINNLKLKS